MWTSTILASGRALGLVTYSGSETRIALNSKELPTKVGSIDWQINFLSKILFLFMALMSIVPVILKSYEPLNGIIQFNRFLILLSSIIPISMRVNLDFAKLIYSVRINSDTDIK